MGRRKYSAPMALLLPAFGVEPHGFGPHPVAERGDGGVG